MENHIGFGWILLIVGLFIAGIGLVWIIAPSIPWVGRLPGDVRFEGEHMRFYFPVVTCLLLSLILSGLIWLIRWLIRQSKKHLESLGLLPKKRAFFAGNTGNVKIAGTT